MLSNCERQTYFHILPMALRSDENVVKNLPGGKDFIIAFRKTENCARKNRWGNWVTVCQLRTIINRNHDSWCLAFKKALLFCRHSPWFVKSKIKNKLEDESSVNTVKHLRRQAMICSSWVNLGKTATTRKKTQINLLGGDLGDLRPCVLSCSLIHWTQLKTVVPWQTLSVIIAQLLLFP